MPAREIPVHISVCAGSGGKSEHVHTRFCAKPLCLNAIVHDHIRLGVKQLQTREVSPQYRPHFSVSPPLVFVQ